MAVAILGVIVAAIYLLDRDTGVGAGAVSPSAKSSPKAPASAVVVETAQAPVAAQVTGGNVEKAASEPQAEAAASPTASSTTTADASVAPPSVEPAASVVSESATKPAESPVAETSAAAVRAKLGKGHYLQAGMFLQSTNAEELKRKLQEEGLPVYIESRVQLGPFKDRKEAEKARERLKAMGVKAVVIQ